MSEVVATREIDWAPTANIALKAAAGFWFLVTVIGQWVFVAYIVGVFGPPRVPWRFRGLEQPASTWNRGR